VDYIEDDYEEKISAQGGYDVPLNIFLYQEVQRFQNAIDKVRSTLEIVMQAIRGEVVVTAEIMDSINAIYDARVPKSWLYSPAGDELSWLAPNLGLWFGGLLLRDSQYRSWLSSGRPHSFWMAGFFNPQGFLTAVQQEITRAHKAENWALDSVILHSEVTDVLNFENIRTLPKVFLLYHYHATFSSSEADDECILVVDRREYSSMVYSWTGRRGIIRIVPCASPPPRSSSQLYLCCT